MKPKLYIAYGSNLNIKQMNFRCPTAKLVGTGVVHNYELQFKGMPHGAYATIAPCEGKNVPVGVWEIQPMDERKLDIYEGYPTHYFKEDIPVTVNGEEITAMVYIMDLKQQFGVPSEHYYETVRQGYIDWRFDLNVLDNAVNDSANKYYENFKQNNPFYFLDEDDGESFTSQLGRMNL